MPQDVKLHIKCTGCGSRIDTKDVENPEWCDSEEPCVGVAQGFIKSKGLRYCVDCEKKRGLHGHELVRSKGI